MENLALRGIYQTNIQQHMARPQNLTDAATTTSSSAASPISPSQRALHAASGNAVPVTPERARIQAERVHVDRSVSLPKGQRQVPPTNWQRSVTSPADGDLTARTAELLDQFPEPPAGVENAMRIKQAPLKRRALSLSLFPRNRTSPGPAECLQGPGQGSDPVIAGATFNFINRVPSSRPDTGMSRYFSANSTALGTRAVSQQTQTQQRRESDQLLRAVANGANRFGFESPLPPATNTESAAQPPSTPTRPARNENDFPLTPVTVTKVAKEYCPHKLAKLRKKEAAPIALTERSVRRLQLDGTSSSQAAEGSGIAPDALMHPAPSQQEPRPGTAAQVATPSSYLGLTQLQNHPQLLDRSAQHPGTLITTADFAPHSRTTQAVPTQDQGQGHRDSVLSLGAPSSRLHTHITPRNRQRRQSTWRTRMRRTKCWKCELEARRAETAEMFRRRTETFRRGLTGSREGGDEGGKVTLGDRIEAKGNEIWGCLRWTCFCRYRGYDSEDEENAGARR